METGLPVVGCPASRMRMRRGSRAAWRLESAKKNGYEVVVIADHGNCDNAINADGSPNTAHSLNPVPFVYISENKTAKVKDGVLADVAPSLLAIMGIEKPMEMTGVNLIEK